MKNNTLINHIFKIWFIVSTGAMSFMLNARGVEEYRYIGCILSVIISLILAYRFDFISKSLSELKTSTKIILAYIAVMLAFYNTYFKRVFKETQLFNNLKINSVFFEENYEAIFFIIQIISIWAFFIFLCLCYKQFKIIALYLKDELGSYLKYSVMLIIMAAVIITVYSITSIFTFPVDIDKQTRAYDVVFSTDSGMFVSGDVFFNITMSENDLRQPLFAVFSFFFSIPATVLSKLLFFIPNAYIYIIMIFQYFLLCVVIILLAKLLKLEKAYMLTFFLFMALSYPFLLFSLVVEQYTVPLFWLILLVYIFCTKANINRYVPFIGAAGSLLTSAVAFPMAIKGKGIKQLFIDLLKAGGIFVIVITLSGKSPYFINLIKYITEYSRFMGGSISLSDKLMQYTCFISTCFIAPAVTMTEKSPYLYNMVKAEQFNIAGIILLAFVVLGFILSRKEILTKICGLWVLFSFIILVIVGWGTKENGMVLYSLYFGWAFLVLFYQGIKSIFRRNRNVRYAVISAVCIFLFSYNVYRILELINYGVKYY